MGIPVLILGESGSGKSTSLRNFDSGDKLLVFNVAGKPLPFKKKLHIMNNPTYRDIERELMKGEHKRYVIDDSQYLMAFEMFDKAKDTGYGKFTDMAIHFRNLIECVRTKVPEDVIVYFLHHTELGEGGRVKAKTVGKMLDNQLTVEGLFSIVLLASVEGNVHCFITQSDGYTTCKSPMDMFDLRIDNDLRFVDQTIREYWEIPDDVPRGSRSITGAEWKMIANAAGNTSEIAEQAYGEFGYKKPSDIKQKDLEQIIKRAEALLHEKMKGEADGNKNKDSGKADGKTAGADA